MLTVYGRFLSLLKILFQAQEFIIILNLKWQY